jgi:hypothetical protein
VAATGVASQPLTAIPPSVLSGPQAFLVGRKDEGATFHPHYHPVNQFQVVLSGGGRIGQRALKAGSFHYADANTPYGPIVTGSDGLEFMTVRQNLTNVSIHMPGGRADAAPAGRNIVAHTRLEPQDEPVVQDEVVPLQPDGLRVFAIHLQSGASYVDDDGSRTCRQYILVMSGAVQHGDQTFGKSSVFFTEPRELLGPLTGTDPNSTLLVLRFPSPQDL